MSKPIVHTRASLIPGGIIAFILSYTINHSIFFGICHMCLGWLYVLYWVLNYTDICAYVRTWMVH